LVSPPMTAEVADGLLRVWVMVVPPLCADTVYPVIAELPSLAGAVQETLICVLPDVAVTPVGAPGTAGCW